MIEPERLVAIANAPANLIEDATGMIIGNSKELAKEVIEAYARLRSCSIQFQITIDAHKELRRDYDELKGRMEGLEK